VLWERAPDNDQAAVADAPVQQRDRNSRRVGDATDGDQHTDHAGLNQSEPAGEEGNSGEQRGNQGDQQEL